MKIEISMEGSGFNLNYSEQKFDIQFEVTFGYEDYMYEPVDLPVSTIYKINPFLGKILEDTISHFNKPDAYNVQVRFDKKTRGKTPIDSFIDFEENYYHIKFR